ncbi:hypothetical protein [Zavarzinia sp. CC-PAN008]|uniref:hypothetical protein n=1 Tax=Zavarzinia sp. CC-PAN008 TaxID=3243332 RepID=UPI003F748442
MAERTVEQDVTFAAPFLLPSLGVVQPAGTYRLSVVEELIEGLSFPAFHRVAVMLHLPPGSPPGAPGDVYMIAPAELDAALEADRSAQRRG